LQEYFYERKKQMEREHQEEIRELLEGGIDLHLHTSPDIFPRRLNDIEAAVQAKEAGLQGIVLKNHFFPTVERAILGKEQTGFNLIGSITLNKTIGGLNPYAVEMAVKAGAKIVWMPTIHSVNTVQSPDMVAMFQEIIKPGEEGLSILQEDKLAPEVYDILEIIKDTNVALATGHIHPSEVMVLVKESVKMGLKKIILTHPFSSLVGMSIPQVQELTSLSDFTCYDCCSYIKNPLSVDQVARYISEIGYERVILTSDGGQKYNPYPVVMLADMVKQLLSYFKLKEIKSKIVKNPSYLVNPY
jgi:hypothetical protein